jgi:Na+/melibiose symporter-like transporter
MQRLFTGLWKHPDFMKLWVGQTISEFGSRITREALPITAVVLLNATPAEMGWLTAAASLPVLLFSLFAGVWVDRLPRRPLLVAADVLRLLLLLSVPLAALTGRLSIGLVLVVTALMSVLTLVFEIAYRAILPSLVPRDALLEGNSKLGTTDALAEIGGPSIAGALIQVMSAPLAILFDALTYLFSALSFALIRTPETLPQREAGGGWRAVVREVADGARVIAANPTLRVLTIGTAARAFFGSFLGTLYVYFALTTLGLTPATLGVLISGGGVGALIGALMAAWLPRRVGLGRTLTGALLLSAVVNLFIPLSGAFIGSPYAAVLIAAALLAAQIAGDGAMMVYMVNENTLRQMLVPTHLLGRANASVGFLVEGIAPLGALVAGALGSTLGAGVTMWLATGGILATAVWVARSPVMQLAAVDEAG